MIEVIPWSSLLATGIESVDQHRQRLVDIVNRLARLSLVREESSAGSKSIEGLADEAVTCLESEYAYWEQKLPASMLAGHAASHRDFLEKLAGLRHPETSSPAQQQERLDYLAEWLSVHILDTDRKAAWVVLGLQQGLSHAEAVAAADQRRRGEDGRLAAAIQDLYRHLASQTLGLWRWAEGTQAEGTETVLPEGDEHFQRRFHNLVAEVSARFLWALDEQRFDQTLNQSLADFGQLFAVDRAFLFQIDGKGDTWSNTHEWSAPGVEPQREHLQAMPMAITPWTLERLRHNLPVMINRVEALPPEAAAEKEILQAQSIQSLLCLPTRSQSGQLTGFIGFDAVRRERVWKDGQVTMLQVIADIVANALGRMEATRALSKSREDLLRAQQVARIGSWTLDLQTQQLDWSPETYRLFGVEPGTPLDLSRFIDNVYPDDRAAVVAAWQAALDGAPYAIEHRTAHSQGQLWVREVAEFGQWRDGRPAVAMGTVQDISEQKRLQQQLEALAFRDPLTGLPNRTAFERDLDQQLSQVGDAQPEICLYLLDVDGLNLINTSMGDLAGDTILRTLGLRLKTFGGPFGHVARLGGDQFAVAMPHASGREGIAATAHRLQQLIAQPIRLDEDVIQVSASIGSVHNRGHAFRMAGTMLRMADQAIYRAKLVGKNRHEAFDISHYQSDRSREELLAGIRRGLEQNQFRLFYQPKVDLLNGTILGLEGLLRWQHPDRGLLGPGAVIPHLEDHPLIIELGSWVIDSALQQLGQWREAGLETAVSVNVSSRQLEHPALVQRLVAQTRARAGLKPAQLELEILETGPEFDLVGAAESFRQLKAIGLLIFLDDFGTGHSSLQTLQRLGPDGLKIDQSFVLTMLDDPASHSIVRAILDLSRTFGLQVVAEGVETPAHCRELIRLGCRYAQGYAIARPMPAAAVPEWTRQWREQLPAWIGPDGP